MRSLSSLFSKYILQGARTATRATRGGGVAHNRESSLKKANDGPM